jgi:hypothetical protein
MLATRILAAALALLMGCARTSVQMSKLPVTEQQRVLAVTSMSALRDRFNANACHAVYNEATQGFRLHREKDWLADCEQLRANLGAWRAFTIKSATRCGFPDKVVCVDALAAFEKATKSIELSWLIDNGRTRLMWIILGDRGEVQFFPDSSRQLADPPVAPGSQLAAALRGSDRINAAAPAL